MIPAEIQVETEEHLEVLDLERTDAEVIRSEFEEELVQPHRVLERRRVHVAADQPAGFQPHPAVAPGPAVFFQVEVAVVVLPELGHVREFLLDALEEVQHRLPVVREVQLRVQPHVDVEILTKRRVRMRHNHSHVPLPEAHCRDNPLSTAELIIMHSGSDESSAVTYILWRRYRPLSC